jgi:predicted lactoylglutathione lyase
MELEACSISLAVMDITVSKAFYEKLGFKSEETLLISGGRITP